MSPELLNLISRVWRSTTRAQKEARRAMCATVNLLQMIESYNTCSDSSFDIKAEV